MKTASVIYLSLFVLNTASAQFAGTPMSVALDNTEFQFDGNGWEVQTEIFTNGDSAAESFYRNGFSFPNITGFVSGDKTITFDYRYQVDTPLLLRDELRFVAYSTSGKVLVDNILATNTTSVFLSASFYLPNSTEQIQWIDSNSQPGVTAWIDNVRIVDGDQTTGTGDEEDPFEANALSRALDNTKFDFFSGSPGFVAQSNIFKAGVSSAQSVAITNNQSAEMGVEINGPITVSFDWKVSSQAGKDFLRVTVYDNNFSPTNMTQRISGEQDWARTELAIPNGIYFLIWDYTKNGSASTGADSGWIDHVVIGDPTEIENPVEVPISSITTLLLDE